MRALGRKKSRQHVANVILAAEKDSEDADPLLLIIHVKPVDGPVDRQMSQTRQQIFVTLTTIRRRPEPFGFLPDISDAVLAMIQRRLNACPEAAVTLKQVVEDQGEIALGFRRKLNSEPHLRDASQ